MIAFVQLFLDHPWKMTWFILLAGVMLVLIASEFRPFRR